MSYSKKILFFCQDKFLKKNTYNLNINNLANNFIGNYSCGDIVFFQFLFRFFNIFIFDFKYNIYGCGSVISSINLSTYFLLNKFYFNIIFLKNIYISNKLRLPSLKFHCSILTEEIIFLCLLNFKNDYIVFFF